MRFVLALIGIAVGCDSGVPPIESKPAAPSPHERPAPPPPPPAVDAAVPAPEPAPPAVKPPRTPTKGWLDAPAWPKNGTELELAWLVSTELVPNPRYPERQDAPLDLVATIGGVSRHAILLPQFGALVAINQPLCASKQTINAYAFEKNEVAKITFYEGGAGGYFVRRKGGDVLEVDSWEQEDGACERGGELTGCPRRETAVLRMHVPPHVKIREAIYEVDAKGTRTPFDCAK